MEEISGIQRKIYEYLALCVREQGYPPSVREIGAAVGLRSPSTVHFHLRRLEQAGLIAKSSGKGRAISLTGSPAAETPERSHIPIVGDVAAGTPILAQESIEGYLTFDTGDWRNDYFALRVRGESMRDAGILPGDLVVVRRQPEADSGEIVVALIGEEATVKRLSRGQGHIWLLPENENYSPIDGTHARILGKVTAVVRRY